METQKLLAAAQPERYVASLRGTELRVRPQSKQRDIEKFLILATTNCDSTKFSHIELSKMKHSFLIWESV